MIQHDVSKHRKTTFSGGKLRSDPPRGYFEALGVSDPKSKIYFKPMEYMILGKDPKRPRRDHQPTSIEEQVTVEFICEAFVRFINKSAVLVLEDAKTKIPAVKK